MKRKLVAILLCIAIIQSFAGFLSVFAEDDLEMTASDYALELDAFLSENELHESFESTPNDEGDDEIAISSNRLIVATSSNTPLENDCGAVSKLEGYDGLHLLQYASEADAEFAYNYYLSQPGIEYVESDEVQLLDDLIPEGADEPADSPNIKANSALSYGAATVKSPDAVSTIKTAKLTSSTITVAVIDTGVDETHSFFKTGSGKNRILPSPRPKDNHPSSVIDKYDHGTHVAGIIIDNTPENVYVRSYNYFYYRDYTDSVVTSTMSLYSVINLAIEDNVDVINMSLGGEGHSQTLENIIHKAIDQKIVVVSAAGNDNRNASAYYPAYIESLITVAATNSSNKPWYQNSEKATNFGSVVDISAPGDNIYSTTPNNTYKYKTGTSMATPFVSAAAAILKTVDKTLTCEAISDVLKSSASVPSGWNSAKFGSGIVNYQDMLKDSRVRMPAPTIKLETNGKYTISSSAGSNAKYYYTTDGSEPTVSSKLYSGAITASYSYEAIKAISVVNGLKSRIATYRLKNYYEDTMYYKRTKELKNIPPDAKDIRVFSSDDSIVEVPNPAKAEIHSLKTGKVRVTVTFNGARQCVYDITVEYSLLQLFIRYFLLGFLWY